MVEPQRMLDVMSRRARRAVASLRPRHVSSGVLEARPMGSRSAALLAAALSAALGLAAAATAARAQEGGEWRMPARDYAATRHSPPGEIHAGNVRELKEVWNFTTGVQAGHEAAPLVAGGLIYVVTPYPNHVFALDTAGPGGREIAPQTHPSPPGGGGRGAGEPGPAFPPGPAVFSPP